MKLWILSWLHFVNSRLQPSKLHCKDGNKLQIDRKNKTDKTNHRNKNTIHVQRSASASSPWRDHSVTFAHVSSDYALWGSSCCTRHECTWGKKETHFLYSILGDLGVDQGCRGNWGGRINNGGGVDKQWRWGKGVGRKGREGKGIFLPSPFSPLPPLIVLQHSIKTISPYL